MWASRIITGLVDCAWPNSRREHRKAGAGQAEGHHPTRSVLLAVGLCLAVLSVHAATALALRPGRDRGPKGAAGLDWINARRKAQGLAQRIELSH